ncbi:Uncharacterised protein [Mycobacteroides abscessus]|nr:Uncharacterised protein [Mycobacteroides abscessus]
MSTDSVGGVMPMPSPARVHATIPTTGGTAVQASSAAPPIPSATSVPPRRT